MDRIQSLPGALVSLAFVACATPSSGVAPNTSPATPAVYVPPPIAREKPDRVESVAEEVAAEEASPGPPLIRVEANDVPEHARTLAGFAPSGWKLAQEVRGDLDATGAPDAALVLTRLPVALDAPPLSDDELYRDRVFVVVLAAPNHGYRRVGFSNELLACTDCGGAFWATLDMPVDFEISNGSIRIVQEYGSRTLTSIEMFLRYAAAHECVVLTRRVDQDRDRVTGDFSIADVDYEKGVRTRVEHALNVSTKKMETFPRANVCLETVKLSETP